MLRSQPLRPVCTRCQKLPARSNGTSVLGYTRWHKYCNNCAREMYRNRGRKEMACDNCGFQAVDSSQICYVDGHSICANCNAVRLKRLRKRKELTVDATLDWGDIRL
jgi:NADH pyrophosphatase NudC (nudix superfamily)